MIPSHIDPKAAIGTVVAVILALTVHEYAHAKVADMAGDDTPRNAGRLSLNPLDHLDLFGTLMIIWMSFGGFGLGWAKPVPVNKFNFKHPRKDDIKVSLAGVTANLLMAVVAAIPLRLGLVHYTGQIGYPWLLDQLVFTNIIIACFNLIPIYPLDGSHVLANLMSVDNARKYSIFMGRYGFMLLLLLLFSGSIRWIIGIPAYFLIHLILG
jgi:Zn-dependent protease